MTGRVRRLWNLAITRPWRWLPARTPLTDRTYATAPLRTRMYGVLREWGLVAAWQELPGKEWTPEKFGCRYCTARYAHASQARSCEHYHFEAPELRDARIAREQWRKRQRR